MFIDELEHERDTYGHFKADYSYIDTLETPGLYHYKVVAISSEGRMKLLGELDATYQSSYSTSDKIKLVLTSKTKTTFKILIYDEKSGLQLLSEIVEVNDNLKGINYFKVIYYDVNEFKKFGFRRFRVVSIDQNTKGWFT
ncbi:hypothetical protein [Reichenbachiella sp. MALMAid0571]|uniref:hypothetical protein n=1 Tax=Reichenbachiella sp. MALMAid0571 TaxID=3143939 RepID=UPI0032DE355F